MAPIFSKNAILTGEIDHFCLVCEAHLKCEEDILAHIAKPVHRKSLDANEYVQSFKKDHIRKIKNKYFCEFCNFLMTTLAKVRVHVEDQTHVKNTTRPSISRASNTVSCEDIVISEEAWNGMSENSCAICNTEYEQENIHKTQITHVLNLVQIKLEIDSDNNIYRKIDESMFHCLTCNLVLSLNSLSLHWSTPEHKNKYEACCNAKKATCLEIKNTDKKDGLTQKINQKSSNETEDENKLNPFLQAQGKHKEAVKDEINKNREKIFDALPRLQEINGMLINFETDTALCKKCDTTLTLDFKVIEEHIKKHEQDKKPTDLQSIVVEGGNKDGQSLYSSPVLLKHKDVNKSKGSSNTNKDKMQQLAGANNMDVNHEDEHITCKTCNTKIGFSLKSVKKHIAADEHKAKILEQKKKETTTRQLRKIKSTEFIQSIFNIEEFDTNEVIINNKICLNAYSFMLFTAIQDIWLKCEVCQENFIFFGMRIHCETQKHRTGLLNCMVVTNFDSEFIREVSFISDILYGI